MTDNAAARLRRVAEQLVRVAGGDRKRAIDDLYNLATSNVAVLVALIGDERIRSAVDEYLDAMMDEQTGGDASHVLDESQGSIDGVTPSQNGSDASQNSPESQILRDGVTSTSLVGGPRRRRSEIPRPIDRPAPPSTQISRVAARKVARGGLWGERVAESFEMQIGDIRQYDLLNLRIQNAFSTAWLKGLEKVEFPDMWTPLKDFADEAVIRKIRDDAIAARDAACHAAKQKQVSHV